MRFVTQQEYEELRTNLKQRALHLSPGVVVGSRFDEFQKVAIYHFLDGAQDLPRWSSKLQEDFGESIRPHLQEIWLGMPWTARKIADQLLAHVIKQVEIADIETTVSLFARIKSDSLGKHSLSPGKRVRIAAPMALNESRMFAEGAPNPTPPQQSQPNVKGKLARAIAPSESHSGSLSYQCPSCGRGLRRGEVLRQEWGDKAEEYMNAEFMAQAGDYLWDYALENFKAFHECVPLPTEDEILRHWKKLALRSLLRYILVGWAVLVAASLFSGDRLRLQFVIFQLVACSFFFVVIVPLVVVLSIPVTDVSFRAAWARKIWSLWEEWKSSLVVDSNKRKRRLERMEISSRMKESSRRESDDW